MSTPFGPQLIGETEKSLNALLRRTLHGTGLSEPDWVTLRLAVQLDGTVGDDGLAGAVADRAHFTGTDQLVRGLTDRGLLDDGRITDEGRRLVGSLQATIAERSAPIWHQLSATDVAATERVLHLILARARRVLAQDA